MSDDKEVKKKIEEAVAEQTKELKAKIDELMTEVKAERKAKKEAADKIAEIEAEKTAAEEAAAAKSGDVEKVTKALEAKHAKEIAKLTEQINGLNGDLNGLLIDNGLNAALTAAKVAPQLQKAALALIKNDHKPEIIKGADGKPVAQIDGKPITEFVAAWSQGDNGKAFVAAPGNGGGGAGGADGQGGAKTGKTINRAEFDKMSPAEKVTFSKEGGQLTDAA